MKSCAWMENIVDLTVRELHFRYKTFDLSATLTANLTMPPKKLKQEQMKLISIIGRNFLGHQSTHCPFPTFDASETVALTSSTTLPRGSASTSVVNSKSAKRVSLATRMSSSMA